METGVDLSDRFGSFGHMKVDLEVCLILHSTRSDNFGVGALTVAEVDLVRRISRELGISTHFTVVDFKDARSPYIEGSDLTIVDVDRSYLLNPFGYFATLRKSDVVLDVGAGDSFSDIYGFSRLLRIFYMKFLVILSGTPLVLAPQTYGPFKSALARIFAGATVRRSRIVATRDDLSTFALRDLGFTGQIVEASDLALSLPYKIVGRRSKSALAVGINVSGLLFSGGYSGRNDFGLRLDYPSLVRSIVCFFLDQGCSVYLVPHVFVRSGSMVAEDDLRACQVLKGEFPDVHLAPEFSSPSAAKEYISSLDFFVGSRMHACIAAFSSGVPVVPIAYSRKFSGLFGSLGYIRTVDGNVLSEQEVLDAISEAWFERDSIKRELEAALKEGFSRLTKYEVALRSLFSKLARPGQFG